MKKLLFTMGLAFTMLSMHASAAYGFGSNFIGIDSGSGNQWYTLDGGATTANYSGYDFGSFTAGDTLVLSGYEGNTFKNGGDNVTGVRTYYRVYLDGDTPGAYNQLDHGFTANATFSDAASTVFSNSGDQKWAEPDDGTPSLLSGLTVSGTYNIEVYQEVFADFSGGGSGSITIPSQTATFDFTALSGGGAVPEPSSLALMGIGLLAFRGIRRKK